jgi:hypothetical protein
MRPPAPASARYVSRSAKGRPPRPPFGLTTWTDGGEATVVRLDGVAGDLAHAEAVAAQIPDRATFECRTLVVLLGTAVPAGAAWRRLVFLRDEMVPRASRASALVMRGYVDVGAGSDAGSSQDLVWGWSAAATPTTT